MGRISLELVPRQRESFRKELQIAHNLFPSIDTINIPDILRYDIDSLEGAKVASDFFNHVIPHLRAAAIDKYEVLPFAEGLRQDGIDEVLVVLGDPSEKDRLKPSPCTTLELIKKFKRELPEIKVYAGIDQYRSTFKEEYEYIQQKNDAGADGFFTQPFFDLHLMEQYSKKLENIEVFWGVSPVTKLRSKYYWEEKNNVSFPKDFKPTLEWSRKFARNVIDFATQDSSHIYFMPIKTDIKAYLTGII